MIVDKTHSDSGFDLVAPVYDTLAFLVFGHALQNAQKHWLSQVPPGADVLMFGGGSGWLLSQILDVCVPRKVIYIDASPKMIGLARQKVKNDSRVDFRASNETAIRPTDQVQVIVTPFILDLFTQPRLTASVLPSLYGALQPGGYWLCTDFIKTNTWWQDALRWSMYRFFGLVSGIEASRLSDWLALVGDLPQLHQKGLARFYDGMVAAAWWEKIS